MKCLFCKKGSQDGVTVFRVNAKGQPGVWACREHIGKTDAVVDPEVDEIATIIEGRGKHG